MLFCIIPGLNDLIIEVNKLNFGFIMVYLCFNIYIPNTGLNIISKQSGVIY